MRFKAIPRAIQSIFQAILIYQARWRAKSFPINHITDLHSESLCKSMDQSNFGGGIKSITRSAAAPRLIHGSGQARSIPGRHLPRTKRG